MSEIQNNIAAAVFKINTSLGSGTGFYIKDRDIIITNYHVVAGSKIVAVEDHSKNRYMANVVFVNSNADLAFLKPEKQFDVDQIQIPKDRTVAMRDQVLVLGFPFGMPFTITEGIISSPKQLLDGRYYIQTDAAVNPGNSGGPVVSPDGILVGVTTSKFQNADNVGFAIPVETILEELASLEKNKELKYAVKCNSCKSLIYEKVDYCNTCGNSINDRLFDVVPLSKLGVFIENAISELGMNPILARQGEEFWEFHQGSSLVRMFVFNTNFLIATSPINELPTENLTELYKYLLSDPVQPYQLGVYNNQIFVSYRVHLSEVFSAQADKVKHLMSQLAVKADGLDDELEQKFGAPKTRYAKE